jgi:hypothetical protein
MRGPKKRAFSLKECAGCNFSPKQMKLCTLILCYIYFKDKIFGSLNAKIFTNTISVHKHMGWVRNVVLMNVYLGLENPRGSGFRVRGHMGRWEMKGVSLRATRERGGRILSQQGGFQVSGRVQTRGTRGARG